MRVAFQHRAVHERSGVTLVSVADDVVFLTGIGAACAPLLSRGETRASASAQAAPLDLGDDG